jgi:hypothetical protein
MMAGFPIMSGMTTRALPLQQQVLLFTVYWALRNWILTSLAFASTNREDCE